MAHERILVADDHDSLRRGIVRALKEAGHEVDEASNGNQAIELLHKGQCDVVRSDLKMGGSDGLDVLRTAKALRPTASVILSLDQTAHAEQARDAYEAAYAIAEQRGDKASMARALLPTSWFTDYWAD